MHPSISRWPSEAFYDGRLHNGGQVGRQLAPRGFPWAPKFSVAFIHTIGQDQKVKCSFQNEAEVKLVSKVVNGLVGRGDVAAKDWRSHVVQSTARVIGTRAESAWMYDCKCRRLSRV